MLNRTLRKETARLYKLNAHLSTHHDLRDTLYLQLTLKALFNLLAPELFFFLILTHPLCKM